MVMIAENWVSDVCHQNLKVMENPPAPTNELSPIVVAKGV
jgi:hypothetical protein